MTLDVSRVLSMDRDVVDDPYPVWAELRGACPVFREPLHDVVVVTRYADIVDVARRPEDFSSIVAAYGPTGADRGAVAAELCALSHLAPYPNGVPPGRVRQLLDAYVPDLQDQLQHVDPPLHTRHRKIVSRWFTARAVKWREPMIRSIATSLIDRFADGGQVEILDAFAGPLPATVIADIIGIPPEDRSLFLDWKEEIIGNPESEESRATSERYRRIRELFLAFIALRRQAPRDDMISSLVVARGPDGAPLEDRTVLGLLMLFLGGGQETTAKALTTGLCLLGRKAELQAELRQDPKRLPAFIEEVLRFDPPVRGIFRVATHDTHIAGAPVSEGSFVQILWGSGNRDQTTFREPDVFDADRFANSSAPPAPTLTFGHGIHLCPGAPLARLQLKVAFEELLARFASIELSRDNDYRYFRSQILRGLSALKLDLRRA